MEGERVHFNLARLKKGGQNFEVAVDPDLAVAYRNGKDIPLLDNVIRGNKIFSDVKKGTLAPENIIKQVFDTTDAVKVAEIILKHGEIQLSQEYRNKLREDKRRKIVDIIRKNAIDPKTKLPHPVQRIENAMEEAKVKIDEFKSAEDQIEDIVRKLKPIIPISMETKRISIRMPPEHAGKGYGAVSQFGKPQNEEWRNDGSYVCVVEIPAGLEADLYEKLNVMTKGSVETKVLER
ncbi:ribosome assembly factor SBDS [Candidatus Woesearchaeota archaeon CG10_big_fil_rev_8_21_14_0_10_44_13]|nr:MAG: ribosome assembly factor SBDS [Candidatus Woesearchaeota archaeon CG10_big_fil_rev_8_21_14_0_10_44_13]